MLQTHSLWSRCDLHESMEGTGEEEEHYEQEANLKVVKHKGFNIRVDRDAITYADGAEDWIVVDKVKKCKKEFIQHKKCLPSGMKVKAEGHPDSGGGCYLVFHGTEEQIKKVLRPS